MSKLLETNLSKKGRLSLKGTKLRREPPPISEPATEPPAPQEEGRSYTREEVKLGLMARQNKDVLELVDRLGLASSSSGRPLQPPTEAELAQIEQRTQRKPQEPSEQPIGAKDRAKLLRLTQELLEPESNYTEEQLAQFLQDEKGVGEARAQRGARMIIESGIMEEAGVGLYYLKGSTPF